MSKGMAKHIDHRDRAQYVAAPADTTLGLLMLRTATGGEYVVKQDREARKAMRKAFAKRRKADAG